MTASAGPALRRGQSPCQAALPAPQQRGAPRADPRDTPQHAPFRRGRHRLCEIRLILFFFFPLIMFGKNLPDAVTRCFDIAESAALIFQFEIFYTFFFFSYHISFVWEPKASQGIPAAPLSWGLRQSPRSPRAPWPRQQRVPPGSSAPSCHQPGATSQGTRGAGRHSHVCHPHVS